ncbi:predicted protein [Histoplasma capsulatum var. duboisii H88]|uniref:Predicted protein n=1 Tax=Ajellomyces capsulatus (strain H88) TaxID=544711 RepID=F0UNX3_AJEC8|nr:predicted protein [Histoplasma capsulatum var. duboisii H88]
MEKVQIVKGHEPAYSLVIAMPRQALWKRVPLWSDHNRRLRGNRSFATGAMHSGTICSLVKSDRRDQNIGLLGSVTLYNLLDASNQSRHVTYGAALCFGAFAAVGFKLLSLSNHLGPF